MAADEIREARSIARNHQPARAGTVDDGDLATVRFAQAALIRAGIDPGPVDGLMGPRTRSAIATFRIREGISGSGIDKPFLDALRARKNGRSS